MNGASIRSAYQQGTAGSAVKPATKCPHCGSETTRELAIDAMIEKAKSMAPKPFKRPLPEPDPIPRAPADATRVGKRY